MNAITRPLAARRLPSLGALLFTWLVALPGPAFAFPDWINPAGGSADNPVNWNPAGVPGPLADQYYGLSNTYIVTYPAAVAASHSITCGAGNVTFNINSPHTTKELVVGANSGNPTLTVGYGRLNTDYLNLGNFGSLSRLTLTGGLLTGAATLHTYSMNNRFYGQVGGDVIGYSGGITYLDVFGGAQYLCERSQVNSWPMQMGKEAAAIVTVSVAGRNQNLQQDSAIRVSAGSPFTTGLIVGVSGTASLYAYNGGIVDVEGNAMLGQNLNSYGFVFVGPTSLFGQSTLNVRNHLWIGYNDFGPQAGHGEVTVKGNAIVKVAGRCDVGDPDNDAGSFLRVAEGSTFRVSGGIKFWPTAVTPLDLRGGLTQVRGGAFLWPAGKPLVVSSTVGNPVLAISGGSASTGPSTSAGAAQLTVGRGGTGTLRVTQPGTVLTMGAGITAVGDSAGTNGTVVADSSGVFSAYGPLVVGQRGNGTIQARGGATIDVGSLSMAVVGGSSGLARIHGLGSYLQVRDNVGIGGGSGGGPLGGGAAVVDVDSLAVFNILHTGAVPPARTWIYSTGRLEVAHRALVTTPRDIVNHGGIYLEGGDVTANQVQQGTGGYLIGRGHVTANLVSSGYIVPAAARDVFGNLSGIGRLLIDGNVQCDASSHLLVDLQKPAAIRSDTLEVHGSVSLAGTLQVTNLGGAPYQPGDVVTILSCTALTGTFNSVVWDGMPLVDPAVVLYDANSVRLLFPGAATPVDPGLRPADLADLRFAPTNSGGDRLAFALDLPVAADVRVTVYDIRGREMATLQSGSLGQGPHRLLNESGVRTLPSGVYFARAVVRAGGREVVRTARTVIVR